MVKGYLAPLSISFVLLAHVGCSAILGIEDAELIDDGNTANTGGAGGTSSTSAGGTGIDAATGTGGTTDGGDAGGANLEDVCEQYCETVTGNCQDDLEVYTSESVCLELCQTMELGSPDDSDVDTVHCRLNQAVAAEATGEPEEHCPFAGLGGAERCGDNCDALCRAMASVCPDEWASNTACLEDCRSLEDLGGFNTEQDAGATVQCRVWHVGAATQSVSPHCAHAAGADPCR
jgi:hypothetical protein